MNNEGVREVNRDEVFRTIVDNPDCTRSELAARCRLSRPSVSRMVQQLLDAGMIAASTGTPERFSIAADLFTAVGVDIGVRGVRVAACNARGTVTGFVDLERPPSTDAAALAGYLDRAVDRVLPVNAGRVHVSVSVPGVVHPQSNTVTEAPNLRSVEAPALREALERRWPGRLWLENDANVGVVAEHAELRATPADTTVLLVLSTGAGLGIFDHGAPVRGRNGRVGQIEAIPVGTDDSIGEALSGAGILASARSSGLVADSAPDVLSDPRGAALRARAVKALDALVAIAAAATAPRCILVGGAVGAALTADLPAIARRHGLDGDSGPHLMPAKLGDIAYLSGVLASSRQRALAEFRAEGTDQLQDVRHATQALTTLAGQLKPTSRPSPRLPWPTTTSDTTRGAAPLDPRDR